MSRAASTSAAGFADGRDAAAGGADVWPQAPSASANAAAARAGYFTRPSLDQNANGLGLGVHLHRHAAVFAPHAGLLVAAEGHVRINQIVAADPHGARLDARNQAMRRRQIVRPDAGAQAIRGVIGSADHIVKIIETLRHQYRPEDLL